MRHPNRQYVTVDNGDLKIGDVIDVDRTLLVKILSRAKITFSKKGRARYQYRVKKIGEIVCP